MRITATLALAAAILVAAAPAAAQNAAAPSNTNNTMSADTVNTTGAMANDVGNVTMPPSAAATPGTETTTTETNTAVDVGYGPPTQPKEKRGFPWGVIGLLGLLGFLPRTRRRG